MQRSISILVGTIYITDITTTEDVTIAQFYTLVRTDLTTMDIDFRLAEDITVGVERTTFTQVIVASATTEDVTPHMTGIEGDMRLTSLIDALQRTDGIILATCRNHATTDSSNLTTTEESIAHVATIHLHVGNVHTTVVDITTTKDIAAVVKTVCTITRPGFIMEFLLIVIRAYLDVVEVGVCCRYSIKVAIADKAIIHGDVRSAKDCTTFTTAIGITLNGRQSVNIVSTIQFTNDDVGLARDV